MAPIRAREILVTTIRETDVATKLPAISRSVPFWYSYAESPSGCNMVRICTDLNTKGP